MSCEAEPRRNLDKAIARIEEAAARGAKVICLQELFRSRYFCQSEEAGNFDLAEPIPGPSTEALSAVAAARKVVVVGSLFERRAEGIYHNTAVVLDDDGRLAGRYRKMHIPDDPHYYEKFYFTPGDLDFTAHRTAHATVGALVCWDQWFPEAARLVALAGAQIVFYPTAIGWERTEVEQVRRRQQQAWETVQRGHAIANGDVRRGGQPGGSRRQPGVLGQLVRGRSVRRSDRACRGQRGGNYSSRIATSDLSRETGATGHSCATGVSTRTAISCAASVPDQ